MKKRPKPKKIVQLDDFMKSAETLGREVVAEAQARRDRQIAKMMSAFGPFRYDVPEWRGSVLDYIIEEVRRQQHDVAALEGIRRVGWMINAWCYALERADRLPTMDDAIELLKLVEPEKNAGGLRVTAVKIRTADGITVRRCPEPADVPDLLRRVFEIAIKATPLEFYREFELCHPGVDGNGRAGKILLNWRARRLLDPFFPPADFWGGLITNP